MLPPPPPLDPRDVFGWLDPALPLALLPVRLETRFFLDGNPPELQVRIFPDAIHADGHRPGLLRSEQAAGRAFWLRTWRVAGDPAGHDAAFAWLSARLGPWRAAWVARALTPTNPRQAPTAPVPDGQPLPVRPRFPELDELGIPSPTWARLLPNRFAAILYRPEQTSGPWWGEPIPAEVPLAPGALDTGGTVDGREWLRAQGLAWTFDFVEAEAIGLGIRIDLSDFTDDQVQAGFTELVVVGVRLGDQSQAVADLLDAHRYTQGLDFIPQGTPTNCTETSGPGLSLEAPDLPTLRAIELDGIARPPRPRLRQDGDLYAATAADAASLALGLNGRNALDRSANAALAELPHALAMNRALWPAFGGHYLDHVLDGVVSDADRTWLRDWSVHYARGAGQLPALLVGAQPYGLLPVSLVESRAGGGAPTTIDRLETQLEALRTAWGYGIVPRLDPDAADVPGGAEPSRSVGEMAALVSQVMAAVPHPTSLRLQQVDAMRPDYLDAWNFRLFLLGLACGMFPGAAGRPFPDYHDSDLWPMLEELQEDLAAATNTVGQIGALDRFRGDLASSGANDAERDYCATWADFTEDQLSSFLREHNARASQLREVITGASTVSGKLGEADEPNAVFNLHPEGASRAWELPLVAGGRTEADVAELRDRLVGIAADAPGSFGAAVDFTTPVPLLRTLLRRSIQQATDPADQAVLLAGLDGLSAIAAGAADPVGDLERLLREALGVCSYRLDAWYTGVAAWRLENKRRTTPAGVQIGAFGFVERVKPSAAPAASQGYVLAPSLTHASTAAILRSGWSAFGGTGQSGALAVDLSSDRVRRARWLVDGVRQGQDLAQLLGARFERGLHDTRPPLDHRIDDVRELALAAVGDPSPPTAIVDGLLLARAWLAPEDISGVEIAAQAALTTLLAGAGTDRPGLEAVLDSVAADLDAVADVAVAQSVFALAQGNVAESAATLTASATGDTRFPPLRVTDTPRPGQAVTHRLLVLLDPSARGHWPGTATSGRALAAPALDAWLAGLLGEPARYRFTVRFQDTVTGRPVPGAVPGSLADVGLAALDAVYLAPVGEQTDLGRLGAVLAAWGQARRPGTAPGTVVPVVDAGGGDGSLADLAVVARSLRRLVAEARDLDGTDLAAPGATDIPADVDVADLEERERDVRAALERHRTALADALGGAAGNGTSLRRVMLAFGGFQLSNGTPPTTDDVTVVAGALLAEVDARLAALDARIAEESAVWETLDEAARAAAVAGRLHLLVGHRLPVAPVCAPANAADLRASAGRGRLAEPAAATGWLAAAGRVDPGARRLRIAIDLTEALRNAVLHRFILAQLPDVPAEGWAALHRPGADDRGRICLLGTGIGTPSFGDRLAGLVLGTWTEVIPRSGQDVGVAVHFDAPSARAPQAVLLCSVRPSRGFDFELVRDVVRQTFDLARSRMVGPQTMSSLGQLLPAVYLDADTTPVEEP